MVSPLPKKYKITTPYHKPGSWWSCGYHTGVDFACPQGTPVFAIQDGKVLEAKMGVSWGGSYGNAVIIDHGNGKRVIYAHLSKIEVKAGKKVVAGDQIGLSGNTGNSSGPHLHLEARVSPWRYANKDIDPKNLIDSKVKTSLKAKLTAATPDKREAPEPSTVYPGDPVELGEKGEAVRALQIKFGLEDTGTYDAALKRKIVSWQKKNPKLGAADGVVGPKTWEEIFKA